MAKRASQLNVVLASSKIVRVSMMFAGFIVVVVLILNVLTATVYPMYVGNNMWGGPMVLQDTLKTPSSLSDSTSAITDVITTSPVKLPLWLNVKYIGSITPHWKFGGFIQWPLYVRGFGFQLESRYYAKPTGRGRFYSANIAYGAIKHLDTTANPLSVGIAVGWDWYPGQGSFLIGFGFSLDYYLSYKRVYAIESEFYDAYVYSFNGPVTFASNSAVMSSHPLALGLRLDIGLGW